MELSAGFRKTEVGIIPEDWAVTPLKALVDASRSIRYGIVQPGPYVYNGRLLIRGQDYSTGWVDAAEMFRVGAAIEARYQNARVRQGDLIITIVGAGTGYVAEIPAWLDEANLTQTTARIAIDGRKANSTFCKYVLSGRVGATQVTNYIKGGAQPGLNCGDVEKFLIPHPISIDEQLAIAATLSDADALIASLDALIAKRRDIKQAVMQQLLTGKTRLPGFTGTWEVKQLQEVATADWGNTSITKASYREHGFQAFSASGPDGYVDWFERESDGVVISAIGAQCGKTWLAHGKWTPIKNTIWFEAADKKADIGFLFWVTANPDFWPKSGQAQPFVSVTGVRKALLRLPPTIHEQAAIAAILSDIDAELAALEARCDKARVIKQGMTQELLTGRIRLA